MAISLLLVVAAVTLSLVATARVVQSAAYSVTQKALQLVFAWVVPLVGAFFVLAVWAHDRKSESRDPVRADEGSWLPGMGPESEHRHHGTNLGDGGSHDGRGGDAGSSGH
jgi:hypothetical protein